MNNRLGDLPAWAAGDDDDDDNMDTAAGQQSGGGDLEMGDVSSSVKQPKHMEHFFREVDTIKADIEAVKKATTMIRDLNDQAMQATTTEEENELSRRLRPLVDRTNKQAKNTKNLLGLLKEETKKLKEQGELKQSDER